MLSYKFIIFITEINSENIGLLISHQKWIGYTQYRFFVCRNTNSDGCTNNEAGCKFAN